MDGGESRKGRWCEGQVRAQRLEKSEGEERGAEARGEGSERKEGGGLNAVARKTQTLLSLRFAATHFRTARPHE